MPNLLAPRSGGAFTAISACPSADVIFVAHAGLDQLVSVRDIWRKLPVNQTIRAKWWRVPVDEVPRDADHEAQLRWLYDWWQRIDAWISAEPAGGRSRRRSPVIAEPGPRRPAAPSGCGAGVERPGARTRATRCGGTAVPAGSAGSGTGSPQVLISGSSPAHSPSAASGLSASSGGPVRTFTDASSSGSASSDGRGQLLAARLPGIIPLAGSQVLGQQPQAAQLLGRRR